MLNLVWSDIPSVLVFPVTLPCTFHYRIQAFYSHEPALDPVYHQMAIKFI